VSAAAALPIFLGMWVGTHIRQLVSPELFRKVILGLVMVSGVNLIANGMSTTIVRPINQYLSSVSFTQHAMAFPLSK